MMTLASLQTSFQLEVLEGNGTLSDSIAPPPTGSAEQRIAIYVDAYRIRLCEALASNFPCLRRLLGESSFAAIANAYVEARPSTYRSIRWFGDALPAMLGTALPDQPWLAELAEWEWALAAAFDSADVLPLTAAELRGVPAEEWPQLRFVFHPSVRSLRMRTNAPQLFSALNRDENVPRPAAAPETFWSISRRELTPRYRTMTASEALALDTMLEGGTFASMCTTLSVSYPPHEAAMHAAHLLRAWIDEAFVCRIVRDESLASS